jgi:hypothetical protein
LYKAKFDSFLNRLRDTLPEPLQGNLPTIEQLEIQLNAMGLKNTESHHTENKIGNKKQRSGRTSELGSTLIKTLGDRFEDLSELLLIHQVNLRNDQIDRR